MLQPTNPYRKLKDLENIIKKFYNLDQLPIVSVIKMKEHPSECIIYKNKKWEYLIKNKKKYYGRQSYSQNYFFIDGSYYLSNLDFLKKNKSFLVQNNTSFFELSHNFPFDIDDKNDLALIRSFKFLK